jgi:hypothetical protein
MVLISHGSPTCPSTGSPSRSAYEKIPKNRSHGERFASSLRSVLITSSGMVSIISCAMSSRFVPSFRQARKMRYNARYRLRERSKTDGQTLTPSSSVIGSPRPKSVSQICATFPFLAMPFPFCRTKSLFYKPFGMNPSQPDASRERGSGSGRNPQDAG